MSSADPPTPADLTDKASEVKPEVMPDASEPAPAPDYLAPYHDAVDTYGTALRATLWANEKSQQIRFKVMRQMLFFNGKRVLDAGCSRGDFAAWLLEHDSPYGQFTGIDGVPETIAFANDRGLPHAEFVVGDFVRDAALFKHNDPQIVTISGSLNTMPLDTALTVLDHAWAAAREALIFNFLPTTHGPQAPPQHPPALRLDTHAILDWAFKKTWAVRYRQDYFKHAHDATVLMIKRD